MTTLNAAIVFIVGILWSGALYSQGELGVSYIRNFTPKEYGAEPQNWYAVQDSEGIMYFANSSGVLGYDGVRWHLITLDNQSLARSLAVDSTGRVFVGGYGQLGYLGSNDIGELHYRSLLEKISEDQRSFGDVWRVFAQKDGIYFMTNPYVFRWDGEKMTSWKAETSFTKWFSFKDRFYVLDKKVGMKSRIGDSLKVIPGGEYFVDHEVIGPWPDGGWLFSDKGHGFLLKGVSGDVKLNDPIHSLIQKSEIHFSGTQKDGRFTVTTLREGVFIFDRLGNVSQILNKMSGLQSDDIKHFFSDRDGHLWLSTNNGISRVSIASPATFFDERQQLSTTVDAIVRHQGKIYTATNYGVRELVPSKDSPVLPVFKEIPGNPALALHLLSTGKDLLAATGDGVFLITDKVKRLTSHRSAFLHRSRRDSNLILVGLKEGVNLLKYRNGYWTEAGLIQGITEQVRTITEDNEGRFWLGTRSQGVLRLTINYDHPLENPVIERFGKKEALPAGGVRVAKLSNKIVFATDSKLLRFDETQQLFLADSTFGIELTDGSHAVDNVYEDRNGHIWIVAVKVDQNVNVLLLAERQSDGTYRMKKNTFDVFSEFPVWSVYPDRDSIVWFGGPEGIIRYDLKLGSADKNDFSTLIRSVYIHGDSLVFAGNKRIIPKLPYEENALRIQFAAVQYENENIVEYSYFLDGFDKAWSDWTRESKKDYTNIPEGHYNFFVKARNVYGHLGSTAKFEFEVLPPWYRTWWAFGLYGLILFGIAHAGVKIRFRLLEFQNRRLEEKVEIRTKELKEKQEEIHEKNLHLESANSEIEAQRDNLKAINIKLESAIKELMETQMQLIQSEKMASVGHMVAGIAHEINNPLTFINPNLEYIGAQMSKLLKFSETLQDLIDQKLPDRLLIEQIEKALKQIEKEIDAEEIKSSIHSSISGSNRIKEIVANLRAFTGHDVEDKIETMIENHLDHAIDLFFNQYQDIRFYKEYLFKEPIMVQVQEINQCILNILTNAVQAIREGENEKKLPQGSGIIRLRTEKAEIDSRPAVRIIITDNGIGIDSSHLTKIFEPFFTTKPVGQGRGLGLSEAYAIVTKHGGRIDVKSEANRETTAEMIIPTNME